MPVYIQLESRVKSKLLHVFEQNDMFKFNSNRRDKKYKITTNTKII